MPNDNMAIETGGKLIVDSRGTVKDVLASKKSVPSEIDPDVLAEKIGQSVGKVLKEQSAADDKLRSAAELVVAGAALVDELAEAREAVKKDGNLESKSTVQELIHTKDYSALSVAELQTEIIKSELDSVELKALRAEKQKRVDSLAIEYRDKTGGELSANLEARVREALGAATPAYYQAVLEKAQRNRLTPIGDAEMDALYNIVARDELDRVLQKIYLGAEKQENPPVVKADPETIRTQSERVARSRVESGVHIANPIANLGTLPPSMDEWEARYPEFATDLEINNAIGNYYSAIEEERAMREAVLKMRNAQSGGYGRPDDISNLEVRNPGEGDITDRTVEMWGFPIYFSTQVPGEPGNWVRISTANVFNQLMNRGVAIYENAMWSSAEFSKAISEDKTMVSLFGLIPLMKLCSDGARKVDDLVGSDKSPGGNMAKYGVHEILTAKFLLLDENKQTRDVLDALFMLGGYKSADEKNIDSGLRTFIDANSKKFQELKVALRAQDLNDQKDKLVAISNGLADTLQVDKGLARICLEFFELMGESGLNSDLGRLKQFYYDGRAGMPRILKTLSVDINEAKKDQKEWLEKLAMSKKEKQEAIGKSVNSSEKEQLKREIAQIDAENVRTASEHMDVLVREKLEKIKRAKLGVLAGYKKDKVEVTERETDEKRKRRLKAEIRVLETKVKFFQEDENVKKWAEDIIKRYQGDGLYNFLGMVDNEGTTIEEPESEALGILNRPLYLRAEEATMQKLRPKLKGLVMEKGALSVAEGLAKGGIDVALEMIGRLGAPKIAGAFGAEATILSSMDKVAGMAQRRDAQFYLMDEITLLDEMKKVMDTLRLRQPLTLISEETYQRALTLKVVPPVLKKEEEPFIKNKREAIDRVAKIRKPNIFQGLGGAIKSLWPF